MKKILQYIIPASMGGTPSPPRIPSSHPFITCITIFNLQLQLTPPSLSMFKYLCSNKLAIV